jgi:hypothetical protein
MLLFAAGVVPVLPGPALLVADFVPCCTEAFILNTSQCMCDPQIIAGNNTTFIQQLAGFAPLDCGFTLTASCQEAGSRRKLNFPIYLFYGRNSYGVPAPLLCFRLLVHSLCRPSASTA